MKENNKRKKLALRRAKDKRKRKDALKTDIAQFMVDFFMDNLENHTEELEKALLNGLTGYGNLKRPKLVKEFDKLHGRLRSKKEEDRVQLCEWTDYPRKRKILNDNAYDNRLKAYLEVSETLMNRLIEFHFDLDSEE